MKRLIIITLLVYVLCGMFTYAQAQNPIYLSTKCPAPMYDPYSTDGKVLIVLPPNAVVIFSQMYNTVTGEKFALCGYKDARGNNYVGFIHPSYLQ